MSRKNGLLLRSRGKFLLFFFKFLVESRDLGPIIYIKVCSDLHILFVLSFYLL